MDTIYLEWTGIRPLLHSNGMLVDPLNLYVIRIKEMTDKGSRKMTEADHRAVDRLKWEGALYFDDKIGPFMPNDNIEACLIDGAAKFRKAKAMESAATVVDEIVKLDYDGPRTIEALYAAERFALRKRTKLGVIACRPMFPTGWRIRFQVEFDDSVISRKHIVNAATAAGRLVGLGAWHPKFGRFLSEEVKPPKK